jgi:hypothetical protein
MMEEPQNEQTSCNEICRHTGQLGGGVMCYTNLNYVNKKIIFISKRVSI